MIINTPFMQGLCRRHTSTLACMLNGIRDRGRSMAGLLGALLLLLNPAHAGAQTTGVWGINANGNWNAAGSWSGGIIPNGIDDIANITFQITTTRTITLDVPVTLGVLNIGDISGGSSFTIQSNTLTFDVSSGNAQLNKINDGGNDTISSAIVLNDRLDITVDDPSNNQGIILSGAISGGTTGTITMTFNDFSVGNNINWLIMNNNNNSFAGQLVVESGRLRYETNNGVAGLSGVGNETIVLAGATLDLRDRDFNSSAATNEIIRIAGIGDIGMGALINSTGTATINQLALDADALVSGYSNSPINMRALGNSTTQDFAVLDLNGKNLGKLGSMDFVLMDTIITPGTISVYEGELRIESSSETAINPTKLDGVTINIAYNPATYNGTDPSLGSRTISDLYNPGLIGNDLSGNSILEARLEFFRQNVTHTGVTINLNRGSIERRGPSGIGQVYTTTLDATSVINIVGGDARVNVFNIESGASGYNAGVYDNPGSFQVLGNITGALGTGFQTRGVRELRLEGANTAFLGDVVVKMNAGRYLPGGFNTTDGAIESQWSSLALAGASGSLASAGTITVERFGSLWLDNTAANNNNRLNDTGAVALRDGFVVLTTNAAVTNTENLGNVNSVVGTNKLFIDSRLGGDADLTFNELNISAGSVIKIENLNSASNWSATPGDDRIALTNTGSVTLSGNASGTTDRAVIVGAIGGDVPAPGAATVAQRPTWAAENAFARSGAADSFLTLDGGFIRPLLNTEYDTSASNPGAGSNWKVIAEIGNVGLRANQPNITANLAINTLTIANASVPTAAKEYVIIGNGKTLTINSGMINFANFAQVNSANMESVISGGKIDMNGRQAIVNSSSFFEDLDRNDANYYNYVTGYNSFMRSSIINADGLVKTGRNNLYLDTWNEFLPSSTLYVTDEASVIARHSLALQGISDVYVTGAGNFLLQYGVNITGVDLHVTGTMDADRVILRSETNTHNSWGGNVILETIDSTGMKESRQHRLTALNDATLTVLGNIYVDDATSANARASDYFGDPFVISTDSGQSGVINLRGQVRDISTGSVSTGAGGPVEVFRFGDTAGISDPNHSLRFRMTGNDEMNVNVFQQWDATGRMEMNRGYFRIQYDPDAVGNDGTGFLTETANNSILRNDYWTRAVLGTDGAGTGTYDAHLILTRAGQIFNWANNLNIYNNNRDGTLTIGGEHQSGSAYIGSDDGANYQIVYESQGGDRDLRFFQVRGGRLEIKARLTDNGTGVNSSATVVGPGTIQFNANGAGASTVERWNFMGGEAIWAPRSTDGSMLGNDRFAISTAQALFGGGDLTVLGEATTNRNFNLTGNVWLNNGESVIRLNSPTGRTFNLNFGAAAATFTKSQGGTLAFIEEGDGTANISMQATDLTNSGLMSWAVFGTQAGVISDFAANGASGAITAYGGYTAGTVEGDYAGNDVNVAGDVAFTAAINPNSLRVDAPTALSLDGQTLTVGSGGILFTSANGGPNSITGGTVTSGFDANLGVAGTPRDLMLFNYAGQTLTFGAVITDNGGDKVNFVLGGSGTTALTADNSYTGDTYINNGVLQISSESQLGDINGSIARLARVNIGSNNGTSGGTLSFLDGGTGSGAAGTFTSNSSNQITSTTLTNGGSGYTSGVFVNANAGGTGNAGIWAILDSGNLHFDGGTLKTTQSITLDGGRTIFIGGNGASFDVAKGTELTINGYVTNEFSQINSSNGYTANHIGGADTPAGDRSPDIGNMVITGGGTVTLVGAPNNVAQANQYNTYGGITWVDEGTIKLTSAGTSANSILGLNRSWINGTVLGAQGTLELATTSDNTIYEWLTFRGRGYEGRGSIITTGTARTHRLSGQMFIESDLLVNITNASGVRFNENGGTFYGNGSIIRKGNGEMYFYGNSPDWVGEYIVGSGNTRFYGDANLPGLTAIRLDRNAYVGIGNGSNDRNQFDDRLPDTMPIFSDGYTRLNMEGSSTVHSGRARMGVATARTGVFGIEVDLASVVTGGTPDLALTSSGFRFAELVRNEGAVFQFRNNDPGTDIARGTTFGITEFDSRAFFLVDTAPATVGSGDGLNGNTAIIAGFFGGTRPEYFNTTTGVIWDADRTSRFLMTVDAGTDPIYGGAVNFLRPLSDAPGSTDYKIIADPGNNTASVDVDLAAQGITADQNLRFVGLTTDAIGSGLTSRINSVLTLNSALTVNSVSFASDTTVDNTHTAGNQVNLVMAREGNLTINSGVLMFANMGTMDRKGAASNTVVDLDMNNAIIGGTLDFSGREAIIYAGSEWAQYNTSDQINAYRNTDTSNTSARLVSNITNTGGNGLTKTGASSVLLESANSYTGDTHINMGLLYARHDFALGNRGNTGPNTRVNITGSGGLILGYGANISGIDLYIGTISGNNLTLYTEGEGNQWGGNVIIDNVDLSGTAGGYQRNFVPRIQVASSNTVFHINGDIYGGDTPVALGNQATNSRIFTTYTGATRSVLNFLGQVKDKSTGALAPGSNMNEALRMEVVGTNDLATVHLYQQYDSAGRIQLVRGVLRYMGDGNFYTDAAALALDPDHEMSGLQMGGRSLISGDGVGTADVSLFLNQAGSAFNLSSWNVGVDIADPTNQNGNGNYGLGNTTGNTTIGGENNSGTITFGTGTGSIRFTQADTAYDRNLNLYATRGGTVDMRVNFLDGGDLVNTSITKVGGGTVNLFGSSAGDSTVEGLRLLGGTLNLAGYDVHASRRVGNGATLMLSGGYLIVDANVGTAQEDFGDFTLNSGGSRLAVRGSATVNINSSLALTPAAGVTMAFVENGGGTINLTAAGLTTTDDERFGYWAVYGNVLGEITDWAAREGTAGVKAFTAYDLTFGSGNNTNVTTGSTLGGDEAAASLKFGAAAALNLGGNTLTVENGGILISSTAGGPVSITNGTLTRSGAGDILLHNYGMTTISAVIANSGANPVNLVSGGTGTLALTSANTYTGDTFVNGGTLEISSESALGSINGSIARLVREFNGTNSGASGSLFFLTNGVDGGATGTFVGAANAITSTTLTSGGAGYTSGVYVNKAANGSGNAGIWAILDSGNLHLDGGTLGVKDDITLDGARTVFLGASGGTLAVAAGKTLTINGYVTSDVNNVNPSSDQPVDITRPYVGGLTIEGGGTVVLTGAPNNVAQDYMYNGYNSTTSINNGILQLSGLATSAQNSLGTTGGWADGTYIGPNGTLMFSTLSDAVSIYEWLTLDGQGYQGTGTIQTSSTARSYYLRGQVNVLSDAVFNLRNGSNLYLNLGGGETFGTGDIIKIGGGDFRFYTNVPNWTGNYIASGGTSRVIDSGRVQGMTSMTLNRNSYFGYDAGSTTQNEFRDRLRDDMPIYTDGYVRMRMEATGGVFSGIANTGVVTAQGGVLGFEYDMGATVASGVPVLKNDYAGWHLTDIVRNTGTIIQARNLDAGTGFSTSATDLDNRALLLVDTAPTLIGAGDGTNGDTAVIKGFFGGTRPDIFTATSTTSIWNEDYTARYLMTSVAGVHPETGAAVNYLRPLSDAPGSTDYLILSNPGINTTNAISLEPCVILPAQNLMLVGLATDAIGVNELTARRDSFATLNSALTINSLSFAADTVAANGNGRGNTVNLIMTGTGKITINSGMIVFANTGVMNMAGAASNTGINLDIRSHIQGGTLDFNGGEAIIMAGSLWAQYNNSGANAGAYSNTDTDNNSVRVNSNISNTGGLGLTKTGSSSIFLESANSYTGDTNITMGLLYARHHQALGQSTRVNLSGSGGLYVGLGSRIEGVDLYIGKISGNNVVLSGQNDGSYWGGNIIMDNTDAAGSAGAYGRNFTPNIRAENSTIFTIAGNIYGGATPVSAASDSRIFSTYTGGAGILSIRGQIRDTETGAVSSPVTALNQQNVLRMEVSATNDEANVQLWQQYDAAGRIIVSRGVLRYAGTGDFYTAAAAAAQNPTNPMSGFQLGGRSLISTSHGIGAHNVAFLLANAGSTFNLASWYVGVDITDPSNSNGNGSYGLGNTTGNATIGGENITGTVTFGTGTGSIFFTQNPNGTAYDRDLSLLASRNGTVDMMVNFLDGGNKVNSSITKIGAGTVNLLGSSAGASTVEGVNVLGGLLALSNYGANANSRVGNGAYLTLGGGVLALDGSAGTPVENFGLFKVNAGGSGIAAVGAATLNISSGSITRASGGAVHFQSILGGAINLNGLAASTRLGSYATFGSSVTNNVTASAWAMTNGAKQVAGYTHSGGEVDTFGVGLHTDIQTSQVLAGATATASVRFDVTAADLTGAGNTLTLSDGGILITSAHAGGTVIGAGVGLTTAASGTNLIIHNFATGDVTLAGDISGSQLTQFNGTGTTILTGTNTNSGQVYLTGGETLVVDDWAKLGGSSAADALYMNNGYLRYTGLADSTVDTRGIQLGSGNGRFQVAAATGRLIYKGTISGEDNIIASYGTNSPFGGGLTFLGSSSASGGIIQFGDRTALVSVQDLAGISNTYSGLTVIGDGTNAVTVDIQGMVNDNGQISPFGKTFGWTDGTVVKNNATLEFSPARGDSARDNQVRVREWFQWGETAGDNVTLKLTTQRELSLDGFHEVVGNLFIEVQNANYGGNVGTGNGTLYFGLNEGGLYGSGNITINGDGNVQFRSSMPNWTGDLDLQDGNLQIYGLGSKLGGGTSPMMMGLNGETGQVRLMILSENGSNDPTIAYNSGATDHNVFRDITVRNTSQDVRLAAGYFALSGKINWQGHIQLGDGGPGSNPTVRLYYEDNLALDASLYAMNQEIVQEFSGGFSGTGNLLIDNNVTGAATNLADGIWLFSADNTAWTGSLTIGSSTSTTLDPNDTQIVRLGHVNALNNNVVTFRNKGYLQLGGINKTFTQNFTFTGGVGLHTSAAIQNAAGTAATITFDSGTQTGPNYQDVGVGLVDGSGPVILGGGSAALNVVKIGSGDTVFGASTGGDAVVDAFSNYTGTTTVQAGTLYAGSNNSFSPYSRFIVNSGAFLSSYWNAASTGWNVTIGSLSGAAGATVNIENSVFNVGGDGTSDANFAGVVSGVDGKFIKVGAGAQQLSGVNTFTGDVGVIQGTLIGGSNSAFGDAANVIGLGGIAFVAPGLLDARVELLLDGTASAVVNAAAMNNVDGNDQGITVIGTRAASGTYGFTSTGTVDLYQDISTNVFFEAAGTSVFQFGGAVQDASVGVTPLVKIGTGTVELLAVNSYGGGGSATVVRHGTLSVFNDQALATSVVQLGDTRRALATAADLATTRALITAGLGSFDAASDGAGGAGNGAFLNVKAEIDGVALTAADIGKRILVKDEGNDPERNGVYVVVSVDASCSHMNLVRAGDFDETTEMLYGTSVAVTSGTTQSGSHFFMASADIAIVNGVDDGFGNTEDPVHWLAEVDNANVALLSGAFGLTIANDINVLDTNGTGSTILGGSYTTGTTEFSGAVTLRNSTLPGVDNVRELTFTSASNDAGGGVLVTGAVTEEAGTTLSVNKQGAGTVTLASTTDYSGKTTVSQGTLALTGTADISGTSWLEVADGATLDYSAATANNHTFDGPVNGSGTVVTGAGGSLIIGTATGAGVLRPGMSSDPANISTAGDGIGALMVTGNVVLTGHATGVERLTLQMGATGGADYNDAANFTAQLGAGTFATYLNSQANFYDMQTGGNHDRVVASGSFTLNSGGHVSFTNNGGTDYQPVFGDVFNLLDWSSVTATGFNVGNSGSYRTSGLLGDLALPDLSPAGLLYDTSLFTSNGIVVVVPEPGRAALLLLGCVSLLLRRRRMR